MIGTGLHTVTGMGQVNPAVVPQALEKLEPAETLRVTLAMKEDRPALSEPTPMVRRDAVIEMTINGKYLKQKRKRASS